MLHEFWHDFGRAAVTMGMGRRWRRFGHGHSGGEFWGGGPWPGERRTRRGDVKYLILEVLAERPAHGYDVILALEARRAGYPPSAGSVYPTLQMLEDESYVTSEVVEGKRVYTVTEAGRAFLAQRRDEPTDGEKDAHSDSREDLRSAAFRLGAAVWQAVREGDPATVGRVREILDKARREVYALLSDPS